jgi:SpoIID/LytB domain protein
MAERLRAAGPLVVGGLVASLVMVVTLVAALVGPAAIAADEVVRVDGAVRFQVADGGVLAIDGSRRYRGTVELRPAGPSGATLVNELSMEDYVAGVAEMPSRWGIEALKAQAVAARTYAWYSIELGTFDGYDICASTACQVFRGADVVLDEGERWQQAVDATADEVLVDATGAPILARYFSTSGGTTYANEEVFPRSGPRPYLVSIEDPDDAASPYHRWTVRFSRTEFDQILGRGETLAAATPVGAVERLGPVTDQDAAFRVTSTDGTAVEVSALDLRDFLSRVAPSAYPDRFPTARSDGLRPLPTTIPSTRFEVEVEGDEVVVEGRGWGHGVGMGQYGARARADRGEHYTSILATYYGGLTPTTPSDAPDSIRVGTDLDDEVTVQGDRQVVVTDAEGDVVVELALGAWTATRDGEGWRLTPPAGSDRTLEVATTRVVEALFSVSDAVTVETEVNKPVLLRLEVRDAGGTVVTERTIGTAEAGTHAATWRFRDDDGVAVPAGDYQVALLATDAAGTTAGTGLEVTIDEQQADAAAATEGGSEPWSDRGAIPLVVLVAVLALPIALTGVVIATRKARS